MTSTTEATPAFERSTFAGAVLYMKDVLSESAHIWKLLNVADTGEAKKKIHLGYVRIFSAEPDQTAKRPYFLIALPNDLQIAFLAHGTYRSTCAVFVYFTDVIRGEGEQAYINFLEFAGTVLQVIVNAASGQHARRPFDEVEDVEIATPFRRTDPEIDGEDNSAEGQQSALESYYEGAFNVLLR